MESKQIGILDIGSNSIRFVSYDINDHACISERMNLKIVARLSSYIDKEGMMTREGIDKLIGTLNELSLVTEKHNFHTVKAVATAAVRNAKNSRDILEEANEKTPFKIEILSAEQEAYYGYLAITNSTNIQNGITVDIGGGSTEITMVKDRKLIHSHSFPFGAVTLSQYITSDIPTKKERSTLNQYLEDQFKQLAWLKNCNLPVIGIGGSIRNIALVHQRLVDYPLGGLHQYEMSMQNIDFISKTFHSMPLRERSNLDGLSKDRADIIIPATIAIESLLEHTSAKSFVISAKGIRDGLLSEIHLKPIGVQHYPNVVEETIYQLLHRFPVNMAEKKQNSIIASYITKELNDTLSIHLTERDFLLLQWAAKLYYIGEKINPESKSEMTFYLLTNQSMEGINHFERLFIAAIASYKSNSKLNQYLLAFKDFFDEKTKVKIALLGAIVKLSSSLNITKRDLVQSIKINKKNDKLSFFVTCLDDYFFEQIQASKNKKYLENIIGQEIEFHFDLTS